MGNEKSKGILFTVLALAGALAIMAGCTPSPPVGNDTGLNIGNGGVIDDDNGIINNRTGDNGTLDNETDMTEDNDTIIDDENGVQDMTNFTGPPRTGTNRVDGITFIRAPSAVTAGDVMSVLYSVDVERDLSNASDEDIGPTYVGTIINGTRAGTSTIIAVGYENTTREFVIDQNETLEVEPGERTVTVTTVAQNGTTVTQVVDDASLIRVASPMNGTLVGGGAVIRSGNLTNATNRSSDSMADFTTATGVVLGTTSRLNPTSTSYDAASSTQQCEDTRCSIPSTFSARVTAPDEGTYYYRAYAVVDGVTYWSREMPLRVS